MWLAYGFFFGWLKEKGLRVSDLEQDVVEQSGGCPHGWIVGRLRRADRRCKPGMEEARTHG